MLALCLNKETLRDLALDFAPAIELKSQRKKKRLKPDRSEWVKGHMPIFYGPDQQKPWVREWRKYIHGDWTLYSRFYGNS